MTAAAAKPPLARIVRDDDDDIRLDRWFKRHAPDAPFGLIAKLARQGRIRVDGAKAEPGDRVRAGQTITYPPLDAAPADARAPSDRAPDRAPKPVSERDAKALRERVLYKDAHVIALDKPSGLATQGGTGTSKHLDGMLEALRFEAEERPRLVHRLDRDTSGVLILGRSAAATAKLARAFQGRDVAKTYWAVVVGVPSPREGRIDAPVGKEADADGVETVRTNAKGARRAVTLYRTVAHAWPKAAWLELEPETGRTHQLRVHCAHLGAPILGDGKHGGAGAAIEGAGLAKRLHLHARALELVLPDGRRRRFEAELPPHMAETFAYFGFEPGAARRG